MRLHDRSNALIKRVTGELALSLPYEDTARRWPSVRQEENSHQVTELADTLILAVPASRTVRNELLLFKPPSLLYFVMAA